MPDFRILIRKRLAHLQLEGKQESDIVEELAADLEQRFDDLVRTGATRERAERAVVRQLDGFRIAPKPQPPALGTRKGNSMSSLLHDLKIAIRMLRTKPGFAAAVIGMLALGISGNTAIFSVFNTLILRPLPFRDAGQLIDVDETAPKWNLRFVAINNRDYYGWRNGNSTLASLAAYQGGGGNFADSSGIVQRIGIARATANLLPTFGLEPAAGRNFSEREDVPKGPSLMMLAYDFWQTVYHGDPAVIGRVIKFNEEPYTIIGVLPREAILPQGMDAWISLRADPVAPSSYSLSGVGRLKPGVTIDQARADLLRVHKNDQAEFKDTAPTFPIITPLRDRVLGNLKNITRILFAAVAVVLLIACVNIAGLMLVRGEGRAREVAIRAAIGASRGAIVRQLLTESVVLATMGGVLGIVLGNAALGALISMIPSDIPKWLRFDMDWRFALFAVGLTGAAVVLFGLFPSLQTAAADVRGCMQESGRSTITRARSRVLGSLAVCEVALAVVLLAGAALVIEAFHKALRVDPGFRAENVLTFFIRIAQVRYPKPEGKYEFYSTVLDRIREIPGVQSASAAALLPLTGHSGYFFDAEGSPHGEGEEKPVTLQVTALPGYLETIGMTFLAGRPLEARDEVRDAPKAVVVNETFANYYWPGQNPVGKRIRYPFAQKTDWLQVVGLVKDTKHYGLDQEMKPSVFVPFRLNDVNSMYVIARISGNPDSIVAAAREAVRRLDPDLPVSDVRTMTSRVDRSLWTRRVYSWIFGVFAGVAVLLAAAGIYGVISFSVSQRTREIGIRMALGARPRQVMTAILRTGMALVAIGIALGVGAALAAANLLRSILFEVSPRDVTIYAAVMLAVAVVGALANFIPARRAAAIEPTRALRFD